MTRNLFASLFLLLQQRSRGFTTPSRLPASFGSPSSSAQAAQPPFTHADLIWKMNPKEKSSKEEILQWRAQMALMKTQLGADAPLIVCPLGAQQLLLEAHHSGRAIGKFGITCQSGPMAPPILETIQDGFPTLTKPPTLATGIAAIIYMVVEEDFCRRGLGTLALEIIGLIHRSVGCDYTVLVADDKSGPDQRLVKWYERQGFVRAPKLQSFMGSPDGQFGVTMIGPTREQVPPGVTIEWW